MSDNLSLSVHVDQQELQKRVAAWGGFGEQLYRTEIELQVRSQAIINKLIDPITTELISDAEQALAIVKKERSELQKDRIAITTARFDKVVARCMQPEKNINESIQANEAALLKAKQLLRDKEKAKADKQKELNEIAEKVRVHVTDMHAAICKALAKLINDAYKHAIENEIPNDRLPDFLSKVSARVNESNTTTALPTFTFSPLNTKDEVDKIIQESFTPWPWTKFKEGFDRDLAVKFTDWELALKNKPQASKLNDDEYTTTIAAIDDQQKRETTTAKLDSLSAPIADQATVKPLKERYKINDPETVEQALKIIDAFTVNRNLTVPQLSRITPLNLSVKQMMRALEDVKNTDNAFEVTGITFVKIEKL